MYIFLEPTSMKTQMLKHIAADSTRIGSFSPSYIMHASGLPIRFQWTRKDNGWRSENNSMTFAKKNIGRSQTLRSNDSNICIQKESCVFSTPDMDHAFFRGRKSPKLSMVPWNTTTKSNIFSMHGASCQTMCMSSSKFWQNILCRKSSQAGSHSRRMR